MALQACAIPTEFSAGPNAASGKNAMVLLSLIVISAIPVNLLSYN